MEIQTLSFKKLVSRLKTLFESLREAFYQEKLKHCKKKTFLSKKITENKLLSFF